MPNPATNTASATVTTTLAKLATIEFGEWRTIACELRNSGATALNACAVKLVPHPGSTVGFTLADSTADFADATLIGCVGLDGATGDPTGLAAAGRVNLMIPRNGNYATEIWASVGSSTTTVEMKYGGR